MKNKKILFISHNGMPYGANKSLVSIVNYVAKNNAVTLISPFSFQLREFLSSNVQLFCIPFFAQIFFARKTVKYLGYPLLMFLNILMLPYLLFVYLRVKPDIIYSNSSVENMGFIIAKITHTKLITHVREFGDLDYNFFCLFGKKIKTWYLNKSNGLLFNSDIIQKTVLPVLYQKTTCKRIYNGIAIPKNISSKSIYNKQQIFIGIVGYIHPQKNQLEALQYLTKYLIQNQHVSIVIFGNGKNEYLKEMKQYAKENKIEHQIVYKGFQSSTEIIYSEIDILLMFSKNEAFGRVTIEAMSYGVPVIGFNGGGTAEIIDHNENGLMFSDKESFLYNIERLISNKELYLNISKAAISKTKSVFSEETYVTEVENFIENIINS